MQSSVAAISMYSVGKTYPGRRAGDAGYPAIGGVDLTVREGEFLCLLGPSGCGKTTLLNLIAGFQEATDGLVEVFGEPVRRPGADRGVIFQTDRALYDWLTVEQNVSFGPRMRKVSRARYRETVEEVLRLVDLTEHRAKLPRELSGGMKQRVQIARVLANEPRLLLMDEPFAALDAYTRGRMQREVGRIWQDTGKTVLFVTHDIGEAIWLADRIAVMSRSPNARVTRIVDVPLPRPREKMTEGFVALFNTLAETIESEAIGRGGPDDGGGYDE